MGKWRISNWGDCALDLGIDRHVTLLVRLPKTLGWPRMLENHLNWSAVVTASWDYKSWLGPGYIDAHRGGSMNRTRIYSHTSYPPPRSTWSLLYFPIIPQTYLCIIHWPHSFEVVNNNQFRSCKKTNSADWQSDFTLWHFLAKDFQGRRHIHPKRRYLRS